MRSQTKWLSALILALAITATGCAKKKTDAGAESLDGAADADTAMVDPALNSELPPIEDALPSSELQTQQEQAPTPTPEQQDPQQPIEAQAQAPAAYPVDPTMAANDPMPPVPTPDASTTGELATYDVKSGDTLMKIAFNLYGDISKWKSLYEWNKEALKRASHLTKGMQLKFEKPAEEPMFQHNGEPYMIKKGDTLATIADDIYAKKSKWKKLWENNRQLIHDPNKIYAGFYLYYQITEQEKQQADAIRAKRLASGGGEAAAPAVEPEQQAQPGDSSVAAPSADPAQPDPAAAGAYNGYRPGGQLQKSQGVDAAQAPRAPASVRSN